MATGNDCAEGSVCAANGRCVPESDAAQTTGGAGGTPASPDPVLLEVNVSAPIGGEEQVGPVVIEAWSEACERYIVDAEVAGFPATQCDYSAPEADAELIMDTETSIILFTNGDGEMVAFLGSDQADCQVGWKYSAIQTQVTLCEESCRKVQSDPAGQLQFFFECSVPHW